MCAGVITLAHTVHSHGTVCVPVSLHWHTQYTVTVLCVPVSLHWHTQYTVTVLCVPVSLHWHTQYTVTVLCVCRCHYTGTHSTQSRYCVCVPVSLHWHTQYTVTVLCVCRCHYTGTHSTQSRYCVCAGVIQSLLTQTRPWWVAIVFQSVIISDFAQIWTDIVPLMTPHLGDLTWSGQFVFPKVAQRMPHRLCQISARSYKRFSVHLRKKTQGGVYHPPPSPRSWVKNSVRQGKGVHA